MKVKRLKVEVTRLQCAKRRSSDRLELCTLSSVQSLVFSCIAQIKPSLTPQGLWIFWRLWPNAITDANYRVNALKECYHPPTAAIQFPILFYWKYWFTCLEHYFVSYDMIISTVILSGWVYTSKRRGTPHIVTCVLWINRLLQKFRSKSSALMKLL